MLWWAVDKTMPHPQFIAELRYGALFCVAIHLAALTHVWPVLR